MEQYAGNERGVPFLDNEEHDSQSESGQSRVDSAVDMNTPKSVRFFSQIPEEVVSTPPCELPRKTSRLAGSPLKRAHSPDTPPRDDDGQEPERSPNPHLERAKEN